jgi:hypothetical protein
MLAILNFIGVLICIPQIKVEMKQLKDKWKED